jgi:hypothetical protein
MNMTKDKNKKSRCAKNYQLTAREVSEMAGCSESYVKKLRARLVSIDTPLARQVLAIDLLANDGKNALIREIERIVTIPNL